MQNPQAEALNDTTVALHDVIPRACTVAYSKNDTFSSRTNVLEAEEVEESSKPKRVHVPRAPLAVIVRCFGHVITDVGDLLQQLWFQPGRRMLPYRARTPIR